MRLAALGWSPVGTRGSIRLRKKHYQQERKTAPAGDLPRRKSWQVTFLLRYPAELPVDYIFFGGAAPEGRGRFCVTQGVDDFLMCGPSHAPWNREKRGKNEDGRVGAAEKMAHLSPVGPSNARFRVFFFFLRDSYGIVVGVRAHVR